MSSKSIKLVVGLGNPGSEYTHTRHNAGYWFVDMLAREFGSGFKSENRFLGQVCSVAVVDLACRLLKPTTFMNRSGQSVAALCAYFRIDPSEILVAHDELDLPAGGIRLRQGGGGHAGHNGLRDIMSALGSRDFARLRIGIGRPEDQRRVVDYVLTRPSTADRELIEKALHVAVESALDILSGNFQRAMNRLHAGR